MATINPTHAFNLPGPYQAELSRIADQQRMAEMLQAQSQAPLERYSYKGIEARTPATAGLAKLLQGFGGAYFQGKAREEEKALGERYKTESSDILRKAFEAGAGTPAVAEQAAPRQEIIAPTEEAGGGPGRPADLEYKIPGRAAVAPNQQEMARLLMTSPNPAHEAFGLQTAQKAMEAQRVASVLKGMGVGSQQATAEQALGAEAMAGGAPGPTNAAASRINVPNAGIPGVSPQAMALMLDQNPQLQDIGKAAQTAFAEQNKPIVSRENAPILKRNAVTGKLEVEFAPAPKLPEGMAYNFGTETVGVAKGFPEALTKITTTKGEAEGENKIETVEIGGRKVVGTAKQIKAILTGVAKTPEDAKSALGLASGAGIQVSGISVNPTEAEKAFDVEAAKGFVKDADTFRQSWSNAKRMNGMLDTLDELYKDPNVTSGGLAENITGLKGIAASLNIDIKGKGSEDAIRSITNRFALELRNPSGGAGMPGAMSDSDRNFLASIPPSLANTKEGRALIAMTMRAVNNRDIQIAQLAQEYQEQNQGRLDIKFQKNLRDWSNKNPLMSEDSKNAMKAIMQRSK
jgi:hypothetical protein